MLLIIAEVDAKASFNIGLASCNNYRALLTTGYSIGSENGKELKATLPNTGYFDGYDNAPFKYLPYVDADFAASGMVNSGTFMEQNALLK